MANPHHFSSQDKKPDRKAMLIRSKAEQNISIKSDLKKSKSTLRPSVKFSQRVSAQEIACKVSRSDDTQVIAQQKSVPNQKFDKAQEQIGNKSSTNQKYENSHGQIGHKSATNQKVDNAHQQIGHKYATNQKFELKKKPNIVKPVQKQKPHRKVPNKSVSSMKLPPIQSVKQVNLGNTVPAKRSTGEDFELPERDVLLVRIADYLNFRTIM